jgi:hypothetical protein
MHERRKAVVGVYKGDTTNGERDDKVLRKAKPPRGQRPYIQGSNVGNQPLVTRLHFDTAPSLRYDSIRTTQA